MKLLYYLPAFGGPNLYYKMGILHYNIHYIFNQTKQPFDIIINLYEVDPKILTGLRDFLNKQNCITNVYITAKKGVLTELFLTNPHNTKIDNYDYILFILDDVKLHQLNIDNMIKIKEKFKIEILSPKIVNSSHPYMNSGKDTLTINSSLEVYCLLMTPKDMIDKNHYRAIFNLIWKFQKKKIRFIHLRYALVEHHNVVLTEKKKQKLAAFFGNELKRLPRYEWFEGKIVNIQLVRRH